MNCNRAKETLPLYAGGDLSAAEEDRIGMHLRQCGDCRKFYEGLAKQQSLFSPGPEPCGSVAATTPPARSCRGICRSPATCGRA